MLARPRPPGGDRPGSDGADIRNACTAAAGRAGVAGMAGGPMLPLPLMMHELDEAQRRRAFAVFECARDEHSGKSN